MLVKQTYANLDTEVEAQRDIIQKLQDKYKHHDREVKDLNREHYEEKKDLLNEITRQAYELKFCKKVFSMMLRPDEIARIRTKSTFDEAEDDWKVPPFIFKQKELTFPKLNGLALVNDSIANRNVQVLDGGCSSAERNGTKSTNLSENK